MLSFRKYCYLSLLLAGLIVGLVCSWLYAYDPFQIYHKPYLREVTFIKQMRFQDKGIIDHYDYDSFIIGDSLTENVSAFYAGEKLSGNWVNITPVGSTTSEKFIILKYLFAKKEPKRIIYGLNISLNNPNPTDTSSFDFLYDSNPFNDIKIYINKKFITCALTWSKSKKCVGSNDIENLINWMDDPHTINNLGKFEQWFDQKELEDKIRQLQDLAKRQFIFQAHQDITANQRAIEHDIFDFLKKHPQTQFDFLIPVYPTYFYKTQDAKHLSKYMEILRWFVLKAHEYPNAKIYGLGNLAYADDIDHYKDHVHHSMEMNVYQIDAIATKQYLLNPNNIDAYLKEMEKKINNYDLLVLIERLQQRKKID